MREETRIATLEGAPARGTRAWIGRAMLALGALAGGVLLLGVAPAQAGSTFERGFKDELGRIAAHEAVYVGKGILGGVLYPGYGHPPYPGPPPVVHHHHHYYRYERHGPPYGRAVGYWRKRGHPAPCGYSHYERYEEYGDGYGGYERYERHYGPGHRAGY